jgi:hypothetical protein
MTTTGSGTLRILIAAASLVAGGSVSLPAQAAPGPESIAGPASLPTVSEGVGSIAAPAASLALVTGDRGFDPEDAAGLQFMVQEEKLAHDLYLAFSERWGLPVFERIAASETVHQAAVARLLSAYGVDNPVATAGEGVFADPGLQGLYDQLLAEGSGSVEAALRAAIRVEETDIGDLEVRLAATDDARIQQVYASLLRGSNRHLQAFSRQSVSGAGIAPAWPQAGPSGGSQGRAGRGGRWSH